MSGSNLPVLLLGGRSALLFQLQEEDSEIRRVLLRWIIQESLTALAASNSLPLGLADSRGRRAANGGRQWRAQHFGDQNHYFGPKLLLKAQLIFLNPKGNILKSKVRISELSRRCRSLLAAAATACRLLLSPTHQPTWCPTWCHANCHVTAQVQQVHLGECILCCRVLMYDLCHLERMVSARFRLKTVSSWRDFMKTGKKAKKGEIRPPKLKTEDPNKSYVQRPVKRG
ncbi:hypothetical protein Taro_037565 [Colocasia esculenta]|uniref:Uncharacterized protein n=1 Tax=Colocasia esculenta TaxID=4460 RepID=A0A843WJM5_COLES|nr:hypothetical protein [Colocasia esculenta]